MNSTTRTAFPRRVAVALIFVCACAFLSAARSASAAAITFAQFQQADSGQAFAFTNSGATSSFDTETPTHTTSVPVDFQFKVATVYGPAGTNIPAELTLTSSVASNALAVSGLAIQPLDAINLSFTADTPIGSRDLLLQVTSDANGSTGVLYGSNGGNTGILSADTSPAVGNDFTFKSDFVSFDPAFSENYALSFSSILPNLSSSALNHYLNSFAAAGTGTFAAAAVPEPSSMILCGLGAAGLLVAARRRRKS